MNCKELQSRMDDYSDGLLDGAEVVAMQGHAAGCPACHRLLAQQDELMQSLRAMPVPPMRPGFTPQALRRAAEPKQHHRRGFATGFSTALAAGVALWVTVSVIMPGSDPVQPQLAPPPQAQAEPQQEGVAEVQLALHQESTVNLVFFSPKEVGEATLSIELPENVEVVGFPGERVIAWQTSLSEGQNILPLPLRANSLANSELLASIESGGTKKSFKLQIDVSEPGSTKNSIDLLKHMVQDQLRRGAESETV